MDFLSKLNSGREFWQTSQEMDILVRKEEKHISLQIGEVELCLFLDFFEEERAQKMFGYFRESLAWRVETIKMFGKKHKVPRESAWYGDEGLSYTYSGIRMEPLKWTQELLWVREKLEKACRHSFNSVLVNHYRNGQDCVHWHADDEKELGEKPVIASLSLGAERLFKLRSKKNKKQELRLYLPHNSVLLMGPGTQENYVHELPRTKGLEEGRINFTFRRLLPLF